MPRGRKASIGPISPISTSAALPELFADTLRALDEVRAARSASFSSSAASSFCFLRASLLFCSSSSFLWRTISARSSSNCDRASRSDASRAASSIALATRPVARCCLAALASAVLICIVFSWLARR